MSEKSVSLICPRCAHEWSPRALKAKMMCSICRHVFSTRPSEIQYAYDKYTCPICDVVTKFRIDSHRRYIQCSGCRKNVKNPYFIVDTHANTSVSENIVYQKKTC